MSGPAGSTPLIERHPGEVDLLHLAATGDGFAQLLTVRGWQVAVSAPLHVVHDLAGLAATAARLPQLHLPAGGPPFVAGLAGFITDEPSRDLLLLPAGDPRPALAPLPAVAFGLYDTAVCRAPDGTVWLAATDLPGSSTSPAAERLDALRRRVAEAGAAPAPPAEPAPTHATSSLDQAAHADAVATTRQWIAAGDLYQLNLTVQFSVPWPHGGQSLARRLWAATPGAPHAAWLRAPDGVEIVSASPETFLRVDGDVATMRPIKGTRPRRAGEADVRQREELEGSAKDHAEHVMIVDLERNDLGRVAVPGTVTVRELAATEAHPTVWHLTSTVTARLRADVTLDELLRATFPCGSVTGAPKRMAVDRIATLEPVGRGVYCGAIGVIGPGMADLSVAIRTAVVHEGHAHYGAGGGIVADSDPAQEWQEVLHKAEAFFSAVNGRPSYV